MIFNLSKCGDLLEQLKQAQVKEDLAIKTFNAYGESGRRDERLNILMEEMFSAHEGTMEIWNKLQEFRLDEN